MFKLFHGEKSRFQHFCALGLKKTGKSTLLGNMALNDIERGDGLILFDTQGSLANKLIERIKNPRKDIYYLDCTHKFYPMGINIFEVQSKGEKEQELEKDLITRYFKGFMEGHLEEEVHENETYNRYLEKVTRTALELSLNTQEAINALYSIEMTPIIEKRFDNLSEDLKNFWKEEVDDLREKLPQKIKDQIKATLDPFLESKIVSKITEENISTFNLFELVKKGRVLIINIPEEEVGELGIKVMLDLMLMKLKIATEIRNELNYEKKPMYLYMNEYPSYASRLKEEVIGEWLRNGDENKVSLNLANLSKGTFYQHSNLVENCRVLVLFKLQEDDAKYICENHLKNSYVSYEDLTSLDVSQVILYMLNEDEDRIILEATTTPMTGIKQLHNYQAILERSIQARSRGLIELARSFR